VLSRYCAGKTQLVFAQDVLVRVGTEEALYQYCESGSLRFRPYRHFQGVVNFRQRRAGLAVGQKTVVTHLFKMPRRNMADVTTQYLLLAQLLAFMLLSIVVVILACHRAATVVAKLRRRHRRAFQVVAEVFHAAPGAA